jgi:hypothetical protein
MIAKEETAIFERINWDPTIFCINALDNIKESQYNDIIFAHKQIEYWGSMTPEFSALMRIVLVQPRRGGQEPGYLYPRFETIFGVKNPSIAASVKEDDWIKLSDRHYFADKRTDVSHKHRLTNNLSIQLGTVGRKCVVWTAPIYLIAYTDTEHKTLLNLRIKTTGMVDLIDKVH